MVINSSDWLPPSGGPEVDSCSNYTAAWLWLSSLQPAYMAVVSVVGFVGNSLVLCVFCLQRKPCSVADIYLGNLAAADLLMLTCLPFWAFTISRGYQWDFGEVLCKVINVSISMNYMCSVLFLMLVSMDRYLALVKPMSPSRLRRGSWAKRLCLGIWILAFFFTFPVLLFRTVTYVEDVGVDACILKYPHPEWRVHHNMTRILLGFLIPVSVMVFCTHHIMVTLRDGGFRGALGSKKETRAAHLILAVLAVFLFCWTPHQLMLFLDILDYYHVTPGCLWGHVLDVGIQLSTYLAYSNSAMNPFLFVIVGKHFRRRAKEVFVKTLQPCFKDMPFATVSFSSMNKLNDMHRISIDKLQCGKQSVL